MLKTLLNNLIVLQEEIETGPPIIQKQIEGAYKLWSRSIYRNAQNAIWVKRAKIMTVFSLWIQLKERNKEWFEKTFNTCWNNENMSMDSEDNLKQHGMAQGLH